jgi:hypothetical protein
VIAAAGSKPARMPALDEVLQDATLKATQEARRAALINKAEAVKDDVRKAMDAGKTFTAAARSLTLNVATTEPFSVMGSATSTNQGTYASVLQPNVMDMKKGELGGPIRTADGALLLWIEDRKSSEGGMMSMLGPRLAETLSGYRVGMAFEDWKEYVLAGGKLEDFKRSAAIGQSPDDDESRRSPRDIPAPEDGF